MPEVADVTCWSSLVADAGLEHAAGHRYRAGQGDLPGRAGVLLEECGIDVNKTARPGQLLAGDHGLAARHGGVELLGGRAAPVGEDAADGRALHGHEATEGAGGGGAPGDAAVLAVRDDVDAGAFLQLEGFEHGGVFGRVQLGLGDFAFGELCLDLQ